MAQAVSRANLTLNSGFKIPSIGYGVYKIAPGETSRVVQEAIRSGYRHVDSAAYYNNEAGCAEGILKSGVPREEVFFTTKISFAAVTYESAQKSINRSLRNVKGLGYIDLMLIHAPYGRPDGRLGIWRAMVQAVEDGKIRSIGVSNYGVQHLEELEKYIRKTDAKLGIGKGGVLSVNQIELHPWLQRKDIIDWCQKRGVIVQAWAPLAQADRWGDKLLRNIAHRTGKSEAQILLRWSLQKGFNPLPKSINPNRIRANADVFDFELTKEEMEALETDEYDNHGWDPTTWSL